MHTISPPILYNTVCICNLLVLVPSTMAWSLFWVGVKLKYRARLFDNFILEFF